MHKSTKTKNEDVITPIDVVATTTSRQDDSICTLDHQMTLLQTKATQQSCCSDQNISKLNNFSITTMPSRDDLSFYPESLPALSKQNSMDSQIAADIHGVKHCPELAGKLGFFGEPEKLACWDDDKENVTNQEDIEREVQQSTFIRKSDLEKSSESINSSSKTSVRFDVTKKDFEMISIIGKGTYGKVSLVKKRRGHNAGQSYALKRLKKIQIHRLGLMENTLTEMSILNMVEHPHVVKMHYAFQNEESMFMALDYCPGGELFFYLKQIGRFKEEAAKFYAANILLALSYLHSVNILYRDLKPENVLVDYDGYLKLTDFGLSKVTSKKLDQNYRFKETMGQVCGTPEYLAPELLQNEGHSLASEYWQFGCLLYEMLVGIPPFLAQDQYNVASCNLNQQQPRTYKKNLFDQILHDQPQLNYSFLSHNARDICFRLLQKDPRQRLGAHDVFEIIQHPWFADVDWHGLQNRTVKSPYKPQLDSDIDTKHFSQEFTQMSVCSPEESNPFEMTACQFHH